MSISEELKPCPFCGEAEAVTHSPMEPDGTHGFVMCGNCGAHCCNVDTLPEADCVTAWNRRPASAEARLSKAIDLLKEARPTVLEAAVAFGEPDEARLVASIDAFLKEVSE